MELEEAFANIRVEEKIRTVLNWPTDTVEIDYFNAAADDDSNKRVLVAECPHTIFIFFPGNPGLVGWYIPSLLNLVKRCGRGFAARGISYAGHGTSDDIADVETWIPKKKDRDTDIPFTVDGQILHKEAYMDMVDAEIKERRAAAAACRSKNDDDNHQHQPPPRYIFLAHSIGCHMIQRLLVFRPDILRQTVLVLYITPFNRMKSDWWSEFLLFNLSSMPETIIGHAQSLMKLLATLPVHVLDTLIKGDIRCENGRKITINLLQQPHFGRNFFELGMEEVRDLPEIPDVSGFRIIGQHCPICILFVGNDKWARNFHIDNIKELQAKGIAPKNIYMSYLPHLVHDYVVRPEMVPLVDAFCFDAIQTHVLDARQPRSRLSIHKISHVT